MSDIVERLRSPEFADVAAKYLMAEAADEIERLRIGTRVLNDTLRNIVDDDELNRSRSLLKEAGDALELCVASLERGTDETWSHDNARTVLSKIKGEA